MAAFIRHMQLAPGSRILDLGGQPRTWQPVEIPLNITILNLPGVANADVDLRNHQVRYVEGDACRVADFSCGDFDIIYSNSVIEHVGAEDRQEAFAAEVQRLGKRYWVQTPSKWFPVEAHCGMPLWWFYPQPVRQAVIERWRKKLPEWTEMVDGTRVLTLKRLRSLFPGASTYTEWMFGFPKSYTIYSNG
ncbi:MAG: class I SAM-dependent methyltransferase [Polyangiales bacterium]